MVERVEEPIVPARIEDFELDEHLEARSDGIERLRQRGNWLAVRQMEHREIARPRLRDRQAKQGRIVMDDELAIQCIVHVQLDTVSA